jgi:hypothetical protein
MNHYQDLPSQNNTNTKETHTKSITINNQLNQNIIKNTKIRNHKQMYIITFHNDFKKEKIGMVNPIE